MPASGQDLSAIEIVRSNPGIWFEGFSKIRDATGKNRSPTMNVLQRRINALYVARYLMQLPLRAIGLKPRKRGFSTMVAALQYSQMQNFQHEGAIIGDKLETADIVYRMIENFSLTDEFAGKWGSKADTNNDRMKWPHGSLLRQATARGKATCRGMTPQFIHGTEASHWENCAEAMDAAMNAIPDSGFNVVFLESTPFGAGDPFAKTWGAARWPTAAECPGGDLYWKKWEAVCPDQPADKSGLADSYFVRVFAAWYEFEESFIRLTSAQKAEIEATVDAESWYLGERKLMALYLTDGPQGPRLGDEVVGGDVWEQLAWRRLTIKTKCRASVRIMEEEHPADPRSCVDGGVMIGTSSGIIPMRDIREGMICDHGKIVAVESMGIKPVFDVETKLGYRLRVTADHLLALSDGSFARAKDTLGKVIELQPPVFSENPFTLEWKGFGGVESKLTVSDSFARFLGYFMGDGSLSNATLSIACCSKDQDVIDDCFQLIESFFGGCQKRVLGPTGGWTEVRVSRKEFHDFLMRLGCIEENGKKSATNDRPHIRKVCIPDCIWKSPKPIVREFLRGLFEADGWISKTGGNVKFFTKHEKFGRDVQLLLLGFGIHSRFRTLVKVVGEKRYKGCEVILFTPDAIKFCKEIGFISERKKSRTRTEIKHPKMIKFYDMADTVESITPAGEFEVFDMEIDGKPVFGAGGFLVHNCFLSSGRQVFDDDALTHIQLMTRATPEYGDVNDSGEVAIWSPTGADGASILRWEAPRLGCRYIQSVDLAEGEDQTKGDDPDAHSALLWRDEYLDDRGMLCPIKLVARVRAPNRMPMIPFARLSRALSRYYGNCCIIPEMNNSGMSFITALKMLEGGCPPIWQRKERDPHSGTERSWDGWRTTDRAEYGGVRSTIIWHFHELIRNKRVEICCPHYHSELVAFVDKRGRMEAGSGHDDDVISGCIGIYNIGSGTTYALPVRQRPIPRDVAIAMGLDREETGLAMKW